jgi:uncharacterized protein
MTDIDQDPTNSPLCQSLTRDGKTIRIDIYDDGNGGWLLEVVDEYGNSTVWDDAFADDQDALDEAFRAVDEDGIDSLIGLPSTHTPKTSASSLSEDDIETLKELDEFLAEGPLSETSMDVATLSGFLTSIAIGPQLILPSEWLPWVWDMDDGEISPEFKNVIHANRIMSLVMRHYNFLNRIFSQAPDEFEPIFWERGEWGAAEWCEGFMLGFIFNEDAWDLLSVEHPAWFSPFLRLGTDYGLGSTVTDGDSAKWMAEIAPNVVRIHAYWNQKSPNPHLQQLQGHSSRNTLGIGTTVVREGEKIGRNDPCPCGSGQKYKKCCGTGNGSPTIH